MAVRQLNGFSLFSTAVQVDPGSDLYRPGVMVRPEGGLDGRTYVFEVDGPQGVTEDEAHRIANGYIVKVMAVTRDGLLWDRSEG